MLASLIVGYGNAGATFVQIRHNSAQQDWNSDETLLQSQAPAFRRVLVLIGPRTCSASELIVNGLKPFADVVTFGSTTWGKPVGFDTFLNCGSTYAAVTFESFNALGAGGYYNGIAATCPVTDDFSGELGSPAEPLTAAALGYLDGGGTCPTR